MLFILLIHICRSDTRSRSNRGRRSRSRSPISRDARPPHATMSESRIHHRQHKGRGSSRTPSKSPRPLEPHHHHREEAKSVVDRAMPHTPSPPPSASAAKPGSATTTPTKKNASAPSGPASHPLDILTSSSSGPATSSVSTHPMDVLAQSMSAPAWATSLATNEPPPPPGQQPPHLQQPMPQTQFPSQPPPGMDPSMQHMPHMMPFMQQQAPYYPPFPPTGPPPGAAMPHQLYQFPPQYPPQPDQFSHPPPNFHPTNSFVSAPPPPPPPHHQPLTAGPSPRPPLGGPASRPPFGMQPNSLQPPSTPEASNGSNASRLPSVKPGVTVELSPATSTTPPVHGNKVAADAKLGATSLLRHANDAMPHIPGRGASSLTLLSSSSSPIGLGGRDSPSSLDQARKPWKPWAKALERETAPLPDQQLQGSGRPQLEDKSDVLQDPFAVENPNCEDEPEDSGGKKDVFSSGNSTPSTSAPSKSSKGGKSSKAGDEAASDSPSGGKGGKKGGKQKKVVKGKKEKEEETKEDDDDGPKRRSSRIQRLEEKVRLSRAFMLGYMF